MPRSPGGSSPPSPDPSRRHPAAARPTTPRPRAQRAAKRSAMNDRVARAGPRTGFVHDRCRRGVAGVPQCSGMSVGETSSDVSTGDDSCLARTERSTVDEANGPKEITATAEQGDAVLREVPHEHHRPDRNRCPFIPRRHSGRAARRAAPTASPRRAGRARNWSTDRSQGVQLATLQALARYWADRVRLAQGRGEAERAAAVHDRDRRRGHPLHPRQVASTRTRCR